MTSGATPRDDGLLFISSCTAQFFLDLVAAHIKLENPLQKFAALFPGWKDVETFDSCFARVGDKIHLNHSVISICIIALSKRYRAKTYCNDPTFPEDATVRGFCDDGKSTESWLNIEARKGICVALD